MLVVDDGEGSLNVDGARCFRQVDAAGRCMMMILVTR